MSREEPDLFRPDKFRLDEELEDQVEMYKKYADRLAEAQEEYDKASARLEAVVAELNAKIRRHPDEYGLEKVTDKAVDCLVILQPEHRKATDVLIAARRNLGGAKANVGAMDIRKKSLEGLIQLFLADYYSKPKLPKGELGDRHAERQRAKAFAYREGKK